MMNYASWLLFGLGATLLQVVALALLPLRRRAFVGRTTRTLIHLLSRAWVGYLRRVGLADIRFDDAGFAAVRDERGILFAANHPSLTDAVFVLARMPRALCVYKAALRRNVFFSAFLRAAEYVPNDEGIDLIRSASHALARGHSLLVFPEGTRTSVGTALNRLKPGFALIAQRATAPVQLIHIRCETDFLRKGVPWWRAPSELPARAHVGLGERLASAAYPTPRDLCDRVAALLGERVTRTASQCPP